MVSHCKPATASSTETAGASLLVCTADKLMAKRASLQATDTATPIDWADFGGGGGTEARTVEPNEGWGWQLYFRISQDDSRASALQGDPC